MRFASFAVRCAKEIVRDPLSVIFGVGFPVILLVFMTLLKRSVKSMPEEMFALGTFTPGMIVFGLSFLMLFVGMLVMNDRNSSFLPRLYSSPMTAADYIFGYIVPTLPIGVLQTVFCFVTAVVLGLKISASMIAAVLASLPAAVMFSSLGLLLGVIFSTPALNGAGTVIINVSALLSGTWFSLDLVGGTFKKVCGILPFSHAVNAVTGALSGDYSSFAADVAVVLLYSAVFLVLGAAIFKKKMKN